MSKNFLILYALCSFGEILNHFSFIGLFDPIKKLPKIKNNKKEEKKKLKFIFMIFFSVLLLDENCMKNVKR